jgi:hypothetical protein
MSQGARAACLALLPIVLTILGPGCRAPRNSNSDQIPGARRPPAPKLAFEPSLVELDGQFGVSSSRDFPLTGESARAARPAIVTVEGADVVATVIPPSPSSTSVPSIRLTTSGRRVGESVGHVVVSTGLPDPKELVLYFRSKVPGTLTVSPSNPYIDLRLTPPHVVRLSVVSSRPEFRLLRVEVTSGPFAARIAPEAPNGGYTVEIETVESAVSTGQRGFAGRLLLISNDRTEPRKEIPLLAMGDPARR